MKNLHILPTDKPSRLFKHDLGYYFSFDNLQRNDFCNQHIYITSDEEIKEGDWILDNILVNKNPIKVTKELLEDGFLKEDKKIILTTDLSMYGVQPIADEFLEWFVNNPSCEQVELEKIQFNPVFDEDDLSYDGMTTYYSHKIITPKEELILFESFDKEKSVVITTMGQKLVRELQSTIQEETIEKIAENESEYLADWEDKDVYKKGFVDGAKWQQERVYSEEEVLELILKSKIETSNLYYEDMKEWFEQFKKK